jgi:hypothetical protein
MKSGPVNVDEPGCFNVLWNDAGSGPGVLMFLGGP